MAIRSITRHTGTPNIHYYTEAGSADVFFAGDLVRLDTNGKVILASTGHILGIAEKVAPGTSAQIPVDVISADEEFIAKYTSGSTLEAHAQDLGQITFTLSDSGGHTVAVGGNDLDVRIVDHDPRDKWTTSGGRLIVRFLDSALQMGETETKV